MKRIAILCCYFGRFPSHMALALKTMSANSTVDWLIFSDQPSPTNPAPNIRFFSCSLGELSQRIEKCSGTRVAISRPYEVHVFRPCFGEVFAQNLTSYDFWGHCDLDVLWGDLRAFLTKEILESNDRVLIRGHLSLYRNTPQVNAAYKLPIPGGQDFRKAFANPSTGQFDEWKGVNLIFRYHNFPQYHSNCIADIAPPSRFTIPPFQTLSQPNFRDQIFYWYRGKVFRAFLYEGGVWDEEFAYIHFQQRRLPKPSDALVQANSFGIGPRGFFPYQREALPPETFRSLNRGSIKSPSEIFTVLTRALRKRLCFSKPKTG